MTAASGIVALIALGFLYVALSFFTIPVALAGLVSGAFIPGFWAYVVAGIAGLALFFAIPHQLYSNTHVSEVALGFAAVATIAAAMLWVFVGRLGLNVVKRIRSEAK
ncbi:MAG: hypothetical protein AAGA06_13200 [Pseudomonadota bacterium]